jgi:serine phosphatase RsbU (regulator of sigma subunit)
MSDENSLEEMAGGPVVPPRVRPRAAAAVDKFVSRVLLPCLRIGREMSRFANRMEKEEFIHPEVPGFGGDETGEDIGTLRVQPGQGRLEPWRRLSAFLEWIGVKEVVFDGDLESNQILDVFRLLWCVRRELTDGRSTLWGRLARHGDVAETIRSEEGLHFACTNVRLDLESGMLVVRNSYCTLTFSRAANAYMQKISRFPDHRAFFRAAPRYGLLAAALALAPCLLARWAQLAPPVILTIGVSVAIVLGVGIMVVFETIGAVQYDKEHQAKQLQRRHRDLRRAHRRIQEDMERAEMIQRKLIPTDGKQPFPDRVQLAHQFEPQMRVGGDYYDFKKVGDDSLALIFADVSGHGMAGAFITGIIKTTFEVALHESRPPREFITTLNLLLERLTPDGSYAAVVLALYDIGRRRLTYVNAGHQPVPMIMRGENGRVEKADHGTGPVAGFTSDGAYEEREVGMDPGDRFILCTDGITESFSEDNDLFGQERLEDILSRAGKQPVETLPEMVLKAVKEHCGAGEQSDDRAVLILEVLG